MLLAEISAAPPRLGDLAREVARNPFTFRQNFTLFAVLGGVAAVIFLAVWLRARRRHEFRRSAWSDRAHREKFSSGPELSSGQRTRRRRRRDRRPRNPTLAQTGGLPPKRDDAQA